MSCYPNRSLDASEFTYKEFKDFLKALSRKTSNPSMNSSEKFLNFIGKIKIHCKNSFKINLSDRPDAAKLKKPLQKHTASHNSVSKHSSIALEDTHPNLSQKRKKPSSVTDLPKLHKGIKFDLKPATQVFNQESKKVLEKEGILSLLEKFSTKETTKEKTLQLTEKFREFKSQIGQFIPHSPAFSNAKSTNFVIKQRKKLFSSQLIKSAIFASWKAYLISKKQKI